jgi:hypothetical protein
MKQSDKAVTLVLSLPETLNESSEADIRDHEAESMGWVYLSEGIYFHEGKDKNDVIQVVGIAQPSMNESNVLWLL